MAATPNVAVTDLAELRRLAVAADEQMTDGPTEWPGRPSRQRLELFLAASPKTVLALLDRLEMCACGSPAG
jgi:hypothetical protein